MHLSRRDQRLLDRRIAKVVRQLQDQVATLQGNDLAMFTSQAVHEHLDQIILDSVRSIITTPFNDWGVAPEISQGWHPAVERCWRAVEIKVKQKYDSAQAQLANEEIKVKEEFEQSCLDRFRCLKNTDDLLPRTRDGRVDEYKALVELKQYRLACAEEQERALQRQKQLALDRILVQSQQERQAFIAKEKQEQLEWADMQKEQFRIEEQKAREKEQRLRQEAYERSVQLQAYSSAKYEEKKRMQHELLLEKEATRHLAEEAARVEDERNRRERNRLRLEAVENQKQLMKELEDKRKLEAIAQQQEIELLDKQNRILDERYQRDLDRRKREAEIQAQRENQHVVHFQQAKARQDSWEQHLEKWQQERIAKEEETCAIQEEQAYQRRLSLQQGLARQIHEKKLHEANLQEQKLKDGQTIKSMQEEKALYDAVNVQKQQDSLRVYKTQLVSQIEFNKNLQHSSGTMSKEEKKFNQALLDEYKQMKLAQASSPQQPKPQPPTQQRGLRFKPSSNRQPFHRSLVASAEQPRWNDNTGFRVLY